MRVADAKTLLEYIDQADFNPNDWEESFLESIHMQVEQGRDLSQKQTESLERIYEKASGGGMYERKERI
jgi:hypothetical protein